MTRKKNWDKPPEPRHCARSRTISLLKRVCVIFRLRFIPSCLTAAGAHPKTGKPHGIRRRTLGGATGVLSSKDCDCTSEKSARFFPRSLERFKKERLDFLCPAFCFVCSIRHDNILRMPHMAYNPVEHTKGFMADTCSTSAKAPVRHGVMSAVLEKVDHTHDLPPSPH